MATKAAKSITINATKYELANTLDYQNGKVQLKAKDVVLGETTLPEGGKWVAIYTDYDAGISGYKVIQVTASDNIDTSVMTAGDLRAAFLEGTVKIVIKQGTDYYLVTNVQRIYVDPGFTAYFQASGVYHSMGSNDKILFSKTVLLDTANTIDQLVGTTLLQWSQIV